MKSPFDIAVIFAIVGLIVVTIGFGITAVEDLGANSGNVSLYDDVETRLSADTGLYGTSVEASKVIDPEDNTTTEASEESIITQGLQSLRSLGSTYKSVEATMQEGSSILGIPEIYWEVMAAVMIIMIFVIIYTWARGR